MPGHFRAMQFTCSLYVTTTISVLRTDNHSIGLMNWLLTYVLCNLSRVASPIQLILAWPHRYEPMCVLPSLISKVMLKVDQATGSTFQLEVGQATRSTYLWAFIICANYTSICRSRPDIRRPISSLTLPSASFYTLYIIKVGQLGLHMHQDKTVF